ncbi:response regulator [Paenibacillus agaridevorans]|uniref:response regulator n=1 Tax=Paenibacillus agaridevorans TaxID=171404 RepID=UPI001BE40900|nr:response regulator [Paenibacillus agaridevorans]
MSELQMIIIDDEEMIRNGLSQMIRRLLPEWKVVDTCEDAQAALFASRQYALDLAIIDIQMPGMNGLELAKELDARYPQMHKIILTGYEKFHMIQTAMRYGVSDYLLKPVQRDELVQAVRRTELRIKERDVQTTMQLEKLLLEWFVTQNTDRLKELQFALGEGEREVGKARQFSVIFLLWEDGYTNIDRLHVELVAGHLRTMADGIEQVIGIVAAQSCTLFVIVGNDMPSQGEWKSRLTKLGWDRRGSYQQGVRLQALGCSDSFAHIEQLQDAYQLALNHMFADSGGDFAQQAEEDRQRIVALAQALETNEGDKALALLRQWKEDIVRMSFTHPSQITARCFLFLSHMSSPLISAIQSRLAGTLRTSITQLVQRLPVALTPSVVLRAISEFVEGLSFEEHQGQRKIIARVQDMIREQYANADLNLELLAQHVYLHPTYLSELFKESTGQKFIDYLTEVRMKEAKRILRETDMKVYEVSEAVGYTSPKYFSTLFRKHYKLTPMSYREKAQ